MPRTSYDLHPSHDTLDEGEAINAALELNERALAEIFEDSEAHVSPVLLLITPQNRLEPEIAGDCDEKNRAMLDRLYDLAGIQPGLSVPEVADAHVTDPDGAPLLRHTRRLTHFTDNGLVLQEVFTSYGAREIFHVTAALASNQPSSNGA